MDLAAALVYWQFIYHLKKNIDGSGETVSFCVPVEGKLSFWAGFGKKSQCNKFYLSDMWGMLCKEESLNKEEGTQGW